jgi:1-acyl-sn-glycerol-3-phosphate acyltransferase
MNFLRFLSILFASLAFYIWLIPAVAVCAVVCPLTRMFAGHSKAKRLHEYINGVLLIRWMVFLGFWKFTVVGKPPSDLSRAYIVVSNHISALDTPMLCHVPFSKKYLTKSTYFNIPIFGWTQRAVGDIGVDVR